MRIVVVGAGPAGLYFALLAKKARPTDRITVIERNPPGATYGWGVVFSEETLGALRDADRPTFDQITDTFAKWTAIDVRYRGETVRSRGHAFSAIARKRLLEILQRRCAELDVELSFEREVADLTKLGPTADLLVGADGVNSLVRRTHEDVFGPTLDVHRTKYAWFGTDLVFKAFTFIFRDTEHGLFQVHGYPVDAETSTFIVECPEPVWRRAGLDRASEEDSLAFCQKLFAQDLEGHSLLTNRSIWMSFITVRCETWHHGNVALVGDAAHTAHFTIGSGTKLAMEDAISLAEALERKAGDLEAALTEYEIERQPVVERFQQAASESAAYFEGVARYRSFEPVQFAFNLLTRSGRITHLELQRRDPDLVARVDGWFDANARGGVPGGTQVVVAPPPMFAPIGLKSVVAPNRVALVPRGKDEATEGVPGRGHVDQLIAAVSAGAGLVLTEVVAVGPDGRISPGSAGLWRDEQAEAWTDIVERVRSHGQATLALQIGHAGRRGACRPRREGVDRPLRNGAWPLLSASAIRYAPGGQIPKEMDRADMDQVKERFVRSARMAALVGFDVLELNFAHGYLPASFISPLSNRRADGYGGSLENRMRFPLEILEAVLAVWPKERPLAVSLSVTDWARGGLHIDEGVDVARRLKEGGCDLIHVQAGQTTLRTTPVYGRMFLATYSDRVRNEVGVPTLVGGNITTRDEVNTLLAAGRADLCVLDSVPD